MTLVLCAQIIVGFLALVGGLYILGCVDEAITEWANRRKYHE